MNTVKNLLGVTGGTAFGCFLGLILLGLLTPTTCGVCVAVTSACMIGIHLVYVLEADKARDDVLDDFDERHPSHDYR